MRRALRFVRRHAPWAIVGGLVAAVGLVDPARAAPPVTPLVAIAPAAGLGAVAARFDLDGRRLLVRACAALPCDPTGGEPLAILLTDALDPNTARIEPLAVGAGRRVLHAQVRSASRPDVAWEALVAAPATSGGAAAGEAKVLWSASTGFGAGGEGSGGRLTIDGASLLVGELRRELTMCGARETLLAPRRLDAATLTFRPVSMVRISKAMRESATALVAAPTDAAPIGSVLGLRGASTRDGASPALVDDDPATAWTEARRGDGRGEFVVFSASKELPIARLSIVVRPTTDVADFAPPRSMWIVADGAAFSVTLPETVAPGQRVEVVFPQPLSTSCLALELDKAWAAAATDPAVGLADVDGVPVVPPTVHTLDDVITLLDAGEADADLALALLSHAGAKGAEAIGRKLAAMGDRGKARAVEALEAAPCAASAPPLIRLGWDAPKPTTLAARATLDACGADARPAIAAAFEGGTGVVRELVAERYARLDPKGALEAILAVVPTSTAARRRTFRQALARVASRADGRAAIAAWLSRNAATGAPTAAGAADPTIELGRAVVATADVGELAAPLSKALLARAAGDFARRWLAAEPLAVLAGRGDAPALAFMRALFLDGDRYLRARAAEVSSAVAALRPELLHALADVDPRVRSGALDALRRGAVPGAAGPAKALLKDDAWTYVRVAAAGLLGETASTAGGSDIDVALADATRDPARSVRAAAVAALAHRGARGQLPAVRARAFDEQEALDVRREAVTALGEMCDAASADELFELAKRVGESDAARGLALRAIVALGVVHPPDLAARLGAVDATELVVKDAIARALRTPARCP